MSTTMLTNLPSLSVFDWAVTVQVSAVTPVVTVWHAGERVLSRAAGIADRAPSSAAWCADETSEVERVARRLALQVTLSLPPQAKGDKPKAILAGRAGSAKRPAGIPRSKGMRNVSLARLADQKIVSTTLGRVAKQSEVAPAPVKVQVIPAPVRIPTNIKVDEVNDDDDDDVDEVFARMEAKVARLLKEATDALNTEVVVPTDVEAEEDEVMVCTEARVARMLAQTTSALTGEVPASIAPAAVVAEGDEAALRAEAALIQLELTCVEAKHEAALEGLGAFCRAQSGFREAAVGAVAVPFLLPASFSTSLSSLLLSLPAQSLLPSLSPLPLAPLPMTTTFL